MCSGRHFQAQEKNLLFVPMAHRFQEGKQVYRLGHVMLYLDRNVIFVFNGKTWVPTSLQSLLDMAGWCLSSSAAAHFRTCVTAAKESVGSSGLRLPALTPVTCGRCLWRDSDILVTSQRQCPDANDCKFVFTAVWRVLGDSCLLIASVTSRRCLWQHCDALVMSQQLRKL